MAKIFYGSNCFEVAGTREAEAAMENIARAAWGTFEGCACRETGFYVDPEDTVNLGEGRKLYRIKGSVDGKHYAETDSPDLFRK